MDAYELINKLFKSLNKLISKGDINVVTINLSNELLETLKIIEYCTICNRYNIEKKEFDEFYNLINEIESKKEQESKKIINILNDELIKKDDELNTKVLCEY